MQENIELSLETSIKFDNGLDMDQKITSLNNLKSGLVEAKNDETKRQLIVLVKNSSLNVGSYYDVNDEGSVDIPWNFKWSAS